MTEIKLPAPPKCQECGKRTEWRLYKNPKWARTPQRYQAYCISCKKRRQGNIPYPPLKTVSEAKSGKELFLERRRRLHRRRGRFT